MKIFNCGHHFHDTSECCSQDICPICSGEQNDNTPKSKRTRTVGKFGRLAKIRPLERADDMLRPTYGKDNDDKSWGDYIYYITDFKIKKPKKIHLELSSEPPANEFNSMLEL
jgi:hypothetical protein